MCETPRDVYRILDANLNRLREGLRAVEEHARFLHDHRELTEKTKELRHRVKVIVEQYLDHSALVMSRDSGFDVGSDIDPPSEMEREDHGQVLMSNLKRAQEASRVLEEFSKLESPEASAGFKDLRFDLYRLEQIMVKRRVVSFTLMLYGCDPTIIEEEKAKGFDAVLFEPCGINDADNLQRVKEQAAAVRKAQLPLIVEHRADLCLLVGALGLQIDGEDIPIEDARGLIGPGRILGFRAKDPDEVKMAQEKGVDYIALDAAGTEEFDWDGEALMGVLESCKLPLAPIMYNDMRDTDDLVEIGVKKFIVPEDYSPDYDIKGLADKL